MKKNAILDLKKFKFSQNKFYIIAVIMMLFISFQLDGINNKLGKLSDTIIKKN